MALLSNQAKIGSNVTIAPTAIIEDDVIIGDNTSISDYSIIRNGTRIGANNTISSHVVIGEAPQDKGHRNETSYIEIGDNNIIREFVTIHRATGEGQSTRVGNYNYLMVNSHLAHNAVIADHCILANGAMLGGHVQLESHVNIGGGAVVHQHCRIGTYSMLSGMSATNHDAIPYIIYGGIPTVALSTNRHALTKAQFSQELKSEIMRAFKIIYGERSSTPRIVERLETELQLFPEIQHIIDFIKNSKRGIILKGFKMGVSPTDFQENARTRE